MHMQDPYEGGISDLDTLLQDTIAAYIDENLGAIALLDGSEATADQAAAAIEKTLAAVRTPVGPGVSLAAQALRELPASVLEPTLEAIAARAYSVLLPSLVRLEERLHHIIVLERVASTSARAEATLAKLMRSYLLGLDAETITMCRAALDVAVGDAVGSRRGGSDLYKKLEWLHSVGELSAVTLGAAHDVRLRGNKVLHEDSDVVRDTIDTVEKTLRVIAGLNRAT